MNKGIEALEKIQKKTQKSKVSVNKELEVVQKELDRLEILLKHFYISDVSVEGDDLQNSQYHMVKLISKDTNDTMLINLPENEFRTIFGCSYKDIYKQGEKYVIFG